MPLLRLLSTSLLASAFVLQASAQSPAVSLTQTPIPSTVTITNPQTFTTNSLPAATSVQLNLPKHTQALPHLKQGDTLLAQTHPPCYTMRSYGFTPQDLHAANPRPSRSTDCTPASSVQLKPIQLPATMSVEIPATK